MTTEQLQKIAYEIVQKWKNHWFNDSEFYRHRILRVDANMTAYLEELIATALKETLEDQK